MRHAAPLVAVVAGLLLAPVSTAPAAPTAEDLWLLNRIQQLEARLQSLEATRMPVMYDANGERMGLVTALSSTSHHLTGTAKLLMTRLGYPFMVQLSVDGGGWDQITSVWYTGSPSSCGSPV